MEQLKSSHIYLRHKMVKKKLDWFGLPPITICKHDIKLKTSYFLTRVSVVRYLPDIG